MNDPTLENWSTLEPYTRNLAGALIFAVRTAGVPLIITSARRSTLEQAWNVFRGRSMTMNSKHLTGQAFDVDVYGWNRDNVPMSFWNVLGPYAEGLGLVWGGRWKGFPDFGHFERP